MSALIRVKSEFLDNSACVTMFQEKPFTGAAYFYVNGDVRKEYYSEGNRQEGYIHSTDFDFSHCKKHIDSEDLTIGYEQYDQDPILYKGELFNGVMYGFDGMYCTSETEVKDGLSCSEVIFSESGNVVAKVIDEDEDDLYQSVNWNKSSGIVEKIYLIYRDKFSALISVDNAKVTHIALSGNYFNNITLLEGRLIEKKYVPIKPCDLNNFSFSEEVSFFGDEFNDALIMALISSSNFLNIRKLNFSGTSLTEGFLDQLRARLSFVEIEVEID